MSQTLSAMKYLKNNKRRAAVLIVSLGLCFVLNYLAQFLLSSTVETIRPIVLENSKKIQYINLAGSSYGIDVDNLPNDERDRQYYEKETALVEKLKTHDGVKAVYYVPHIYEVITPAIGNMTVEIPLVNKDEISVFLEHFGAAIKEGRLPENAGEIVLDEASVKNNGFTLGGFFNEKSYGEKFKIVGITDCDYYFGCGTPTDEYSSYPVITVLSDGIDDMSAELLKEGITVRETYDSVLDHKWGEKFLKDEVSGIIDTSTQYIYIGIVILLSISLFIVYTMYLRDRHNEWCLYSSIGYSGRKIYFSVMRELLFTFGTALLIGGVLIIVSVFVLDAVMLNPIGIRCAYFHPATLIEILCSYVALIGILQLPICYALCKIRTIDAIDNDLY